MLDAIYEKLFNIRGRQLSTELSWLSPLVALPPEDEVGILLGRDRFGRKVFLDYYRLKSMHGLIVGPTGSGKSTLARDIGLKWVAQGGKACYIDPAGEQERWVLRMGGAAFDLRRGVNADAPFDSLGEEWYHRLAKILGATLGWHPSTTSAFESLLLKHGSVEDALSEVRAKSYDVLMKPIAVCENILKYLVGEVDPLAAWREALTCFALHELSEDLARLLGTLVADAVWRYGIRRGITHRPELFLFLDEAHRYVELRAFTETQTYIESIARTVRKYSIAVVILSQRVHDVESSVREQVGWKVALPGSAPTYLSAVRETFGASEAQLGWLSSAVVGRALLVKEGVPRPTRVFLELDPRSLQ